MKNKRNQKNIIWKILLIVFSIVLIICLIIIGIQKYQQKKQQEYYEALLENAGSQPQATEEVPEPETEEAPDVLKSLGIEIPEKDIDFTALKEENSDVYAWIYVPGTNINYPVVQTNNNSKYLNTLFDGTANASGAIFLDSDDTAPGMVDQQTTIYGHHMNDGSMFNVISDTTDQATFDSMDYVYYITRDATYKLRPLATKVVEDTYAKARTPNFEGDDGLKNYLSEMLDGASAVASDATDRAASATKVVTLVTCRSLSFSNTRAVMVLTLVEE